MAGKIILMSQFRQLVLLKKQNTGIKTIAKSLSISKNTVKAYLQKIQNGQWDLEALLLLEDHELEKRFHAGNPAYADRRFEILKDKLDYFVTQLKRKDEQVSRKLLWEEYIKTNPDCYSFTQFCFHLNQHLLAKHPTMVLTHIAGEKLYIDFTGRTRSYVDFMSGEVIECQLFVACLPSSDYGFVYAVPSQKSEDFLHALAQCLSFLGGVPQLIVPDNLKSAVTKTSRYEPVINHAFEQFANHYGAAILPARPYKPRDKAKVEGFVKSVYGRVLAPLRDQIFHSLAELNAALATHNHKFNQTRMQRSEYSREELFLANEKATLKPLPAAPFELEYTHLATVLNNNHVKLTEDNHHYSVPYQYIGKQAKLIYTRSLVTIYIERNKVATHVRNRTSGKYTYKEEHLCSHHQFYLKRSPEYYLKEASKVSQVLVQYFEYIFLEERHPELKYKTCDGLISLQKQYREQKEHFDKACQIAMNNNIRTYQFVKEVLQNKTYLCDDSISNQAQIPVHENIRGAQYYLSF
jgi:transposase